MVLTAMAVVVGAAVILFDPIFQGLAISLMAGEVASLFISRMAVPALYFMANNRVRATPCPRSSTDPIRAQTPVSIARTDEAIRDTSPG